MNPLPHYCVIVPDGMADRPVEELAGKTPLEAARTPHMDAIAAMGRMGRVHTIPSGFHPGSDVGHLSLLGYDPDRYYTGRAPLEAASMGLKLQKGQIVFRCNLVTISEHVMVDFSAGHIATNEAVVLIGLLNQELGDHDITFHPGLSYRHLMVYSGHEDLSAQCTPPHDIQGQPIKPHLPRGKGEKFLVDLMERARHVIADRTINEVRLDLGENPANQIWLWGQGRPMVLESFEKTHGMPGAMIAAVDLIRGIGLSIGLDLIDVPGATGYTDTDYAAKGRYAVNALKKPYPFVFVHIEAPDEAAHAGDAAAKVHAIEEIDKHIVGPIHAYLQSLKDPYRIMVVPDHPTTLASRTHTGDPVPFALCGEGVEGIRKGPFTEKNVADTDLVLEQGHDLMEFFIGR